MRALGWIGLVLNVTVFLGGIALDIPTPSIVMAGFGAVCSSLSIALMSERA